MDTTSVPQFFSEMSHQTAADDDWEQLSTTPVSPTWPKLANSSSAPLLPKPTSGPQFFSERSQHTADDADSERLNVAPVAPRQVCSTNAAVGPTGGHVAPPSSRSSLPRTNQPVSLKSPPHSSRHTVSPQLAPSSKAKIPFSPLLLQRDVQNPVPSSIRPTAESKSKSWGQLPMTGNGIAAGGMCKTICNAQVPPRLMHDAIEDPWLVGAKVRRQNTDSVVERPWHQDANDDPWTVRPGARRQLTDPMLKRPQRQDASDEARSPGVRACRLRKVAPRPVIMPTGPWVPHSPASPGLPVTPASPQLPVPRAPLMPQQQQMALPKELEVPATVRGCSPSVPATVRGCSPSVACQQDMSSDQTFEI
mmetsp:Transcript_92656/g.183894  ORF Transcript_92656/g.183894 Transcript_92656/m.183894 type:complete len:363 (-) Transcript_92656:345-1433(-)